MQRLGAVAPGRAVRVGPTLFDFEQATLPASDRDMWEKQTFGYVYPNRRLVVFTLR